MGVPAILWMPCRPQPDSVGWPPPTIFDCVGWALPTIFPSPNRGDRLAFTPCLSEKNAPRLQIFANPVSLPRHPTLPEIHPALRLRTFQQVSNPSE